MHTNQTASAAQHRALAPAKFTRHNHRQQTTQATSQQHCKNKQTCNIKARDGSFNRGDYNHDLKSAVKLYSRLSNERNEQEICGPHLFPDKVRDIRGCCGRRGAVRRFDRNLKLIQDGLYSLIAPTSNFKCPLMQHLPGWMLQKQKMTGLHFHTMMSRLHPARCELWCEGSTWWKPQSTLVLILCTH